MKTPLSSQDALISGPQAMPSDLISAVFDADQQKIVVRFRDGKIAQVPVSAFEELVGATVSDYEFLDGTRAGVTCLTENVDFAVAASWWRRQAQ